MNIGEGEIQIDQLYRFDRGPIQRLRSGNVVLGGRFDDLEIPFDARELEMWFVAQADLWPVLSP